MAPNTMDGDVRRVMWWSGQELTRDQVAEDMWQSAAEATENADWVPVPRVQLGGVSSE